jgi:hypothetical protein
VVGQFVVIENGKNLVFFNIKNPPMVFFTTRLVPDVLLVMIRAMVSVDPKENSRIIMRTLRIDPSERSNQNLLC